MLIVFELRVLGWRMFLVALYLCREARLPLLLKDGARDKCDLRLPPFFFYIQALERFLIHLIYIQNISPYIHLHAVNAHENLIIIFSQYDPTPSHD